MSNITHVRETPARIDEMVSLSPCNIEEKPPEHICQTAKYKERGGDDER
jgi:hypothetical protein